MGQDHNEANLWIDPALTINTITIHRTITCFVVEILLTGLPFLGMSSTGTVPKYLQATNAKYESYSHGFYISCHVLMCTFTIKANSTVAKDPPMKPSQVFFGDSLIKGVLPKKNPKK